MNKMEIYTTVTLNNAHALLKQAESYPTPNNEYDLEVLDNIISEIQKHHDALPRKRGNSQLRTLLRFAIEYLEDAREDYLIDCLTKN